MEIIPGVYQLNIPMPDSPLGHLNSYLVRGDKGCLLIDTGMDTEEAFRSLEAQLGDLGLRFGDITLTVITHVHPDHYGLAGRISQISPTRFAFHLWEKALIESRYIHFTELQDKMEQFLRNHGVPPTLANPLKKASLPFLDFVTVAWPDEVLYGGEMLTFGDLQFEVLWTPGHSPGHVCLYEPSKKLLFSGDHILPHITPNVGYHLQSGSNPLGDYINSLSQLRRLPVNLVLPAHETAFEDMEQRIEEIIRHHDERKDNILAVIGNTPKTAYQITTEFPWHAKDNKFDNLSPFSQRLAVMEIIAHLELLRMEARVERFNYEGAIFYERVAA